ncbi:DOMON-like domain-containing protein [Hydrogenophaga sp.]|uniref:DOMON-like domain-containing protein n=1 Tax=Hydrogenophaga sp. TaxID=1904254 RepID=UPI003F6CEA25
MTFQPTPSQGLPAQALPLLCHPATPCAHDLQITASMALAGAVVGSAATGGLLLSYRISGNVSALKIPLRATPGAADGLWQHTCFEAFVKVPGESAYCEFNFSPSGQWAAYRFSDERVRDTTAEAAQGRIEPHIDMGLDANTLHLQAWLPHSALPAAPAGQPLQWGLTAVVEDRSGQLSYWALHHPAAKPDFHHRGGLTWAASLTRFHAFPASPNTP